MAQKLQKQKSKNKIWAREKQKTRYPPEKHQRKASEEHPWEQYDYSCCKDKALNKEGRLRVWKCGIHKAEVNGNITTGHSGVQVSSNML